MHSIAYFFFPG